MSPAKTAAAALLSTMLLVSSPAYAQVTFNITVGPPPQQYEVVPVMPAGYVWAPGYWAWHTDRHIWIHGRTLVQRVGYSWEPDVWEQRDNRYYRHPGRWKSNATYVSVDSKGHKPPKHHNKERKERENKGKPGKGDKHKD